MTEYEFNKMVDDIRSNESLIETLMKRAEKQERDGFHESAENWMARAIKVDNETNEMKKQIEQEKKRRGLV